MYGDAPEWSEWVQVKQLMGKGDKPKALVVLKRKKMLEKQAQAIQNVRPCCRMQPSRSHYSRSVRKRRTPEFPHFSFCSKRGSCCVRLGFTL
jgi:hypothetical protein